MIAARSTNSLPLFVTFGTREKKISIEAESPMTFVYDAVTQMTYYMGGASSTMSKRSVRRRSLLGGHYDSNEECKDDEC